MATTAGQGEGKTAFVRDLLQHDSRANERSINEAWKAAGNDGTISGTLVSKIRKDLGLTGKGQSADGSSTGEAARTGVSITTCRPPGPGRARAATPRGASDR